MTPYFLRGCRDKKNNKGQKYPSEQGGHIHIYIPPQEGNFDKKPSDFVQRQKKAEVFFLLLPSV